MFTIPSNLNTGIRIPERTPPETPKTNRPENIEPISVSILKAAKMLDISRPSLYLLIKEGKVRTAKIGRRTLVYVPSLHEIFNRKNTSENSSENRDELQGENE